MLVLSTTGEPVAWVMGGIRSVMITPVLRDIVIPATPPPCGSVTLAFATSPITKMRWRERRRLRPINSFRNDFHPVAATVPVLRQPQFPDEIYGLRPFEGPEWLPARARTRPRERGDQSRARWS